MTTHNGVTCQTVDLVIYCERDVVVARAIRNTNRRAVVHSGSISIGGNPSVECYYGISVLVFPFIVSIPLSDRPWIDTYALANRTRPRRPQGSACRRQDDGSSYHCLTQSL